MNTTHRESGIRHTLWSSLVKPKREKFYKTRETLEVFLDMLWHLVQPALTKLNSFQPYEQPGQSCVRMWTYQNFLKCERIGSIFINLGCIKILIPIIHSTATALALEMSNLVLVLYVSTLLLSANATFTLTRTSEFPSCKPPTGDNKEFKVSTPVKWRIHKTKEKESTRRRRNSGFSSTGNTKEKRFHWVDTVNATLSVQFSSTLQPTMVEI